jgi:hypothetical protein
VGELSPAGGEALDDGHVAAHFVCVVICVWWSGHVDGSYL